MAFYNRYNYKSSTEHRIFKEGDRRNYTIKSYRQVEARWKPVYQDTDREVDWQVYQVDQDSTEDAIWERIYKVDRIVP